MDTTAHNKVDGMVYSQASMRYGQYNRLSLKTRILNFINKFLKCLNFLLLRGETININDEFANINFKLLRSK